jgi:WD40 repeat protein
LAFSADGRTLISGGGGSVIRLWDVDNGRERLPATPLPRVEGGEGRVRQGLQTSIWSLAHSPDGRTLAFSGWAWEGIQLWDRTAGREAGTIPGTHSSFAFAPDGKTLAAASNQVALWDVAGRRLGRRLAGDSRREDGIPYDGYTHVAFSPDGKLVAGAGLVARTRRGVNQLDDAMVQLWDTATGKKVRRLGLREGPEDLGAADTVAFSPDGKLLFAAGRKIRVWEVATGKPLARLSAAMTEAADEQPPAAVFDPSEPHVLTHIVPAPDGKMLAINRRRRGIPVWETATGRPRLLLEGHEEATVAITFSPDGRTLASSSWDNTIRLWDLETGQQLRRLVGHRGKAAALVFSPDGKALISAGDDTTLLFWDVAQITHRATDRSPGNVGEALWQDLADADAARAYRAMTALSAAPEQALALLQGRLHPARSFDGQRTARLINELDSNRFAVREKAARELEALGESAEPSLHKALERPPSAESRRRIEQVLDNTALPSGDALRQLRAVEVLEQIGTPAARQVLETLAQGAKESRLSHEAKASLERLLKRTSSTP